MIKLAVDIMGGDFAPNEQIKGVNIALGEYKDIELSLYGDEKAILEGLDPKYRDRVHIYNYPDKVDMGEKNPIGEIRRNKDTSLVQAFNAVKEKTVDGVVTCGPTQCVVAAAHMVIRRMPGMKRCALCPELPEMGGKSRILLDCGANVELRPEHLVQLAEYATIYVREIKGIKNPVVGLLNIGAEPGKGREVDKEAYYLLKEDKNINFYGNIEPKEMLMSECDILLSDGFTGNMCLKTLEGTAKTIGVFLKTEIKKSFMSKIGYLFMKKVFKKFKATMNPDKVGGATLFGADGVVFKAHGASKAETFAVAIGTARNQVEKDIVNKMKKLIEENPLTEETND